MQKKLTEQDKRLLSSARGVIFSGYMRSGKDTAADLFVAWSQAELAGKKVKKLSFAGPLKNIATIMFGWDGHKNDLSEQGIKGRRLLQLLGTECGRNFDQNVWTKKMVAALSGDGTGSGPSNLKEKYDEVMQLANSQGQLSQAQTAALAVAVAIFSDWSPSKLVSAPAPMLKSIIELGLNYNAQAFLTAPDRLEAINISDDDRCESFYVVSDCRFRNELELLRHKGFCAVRIERFNEPMTPHISESALDNEKFDFIIENKADLADFTSKIRQLYDCC